MLPRMLPVAIRFLFTRSRRFSRRPWPALPALLLLAGSHGTAGAADSPTRAERLAWGAERVAQSCADIERDALAPHPTPSVRAVAAAALGFLELNEPPQRAERLVRHVFALQDLDSNSPGYGTVPWQEGHPEIQDANAIEFTMQPVAVLLLRHRAKLSPAFLQDAVPHVHAALAAIRRHRVPVRYSNIYLMKLANQMLLGQAVGDADARAEGRANFAAWLAETRAHGIAEYDSPVYSPIQLDCLALAAELTDDFQLRPQLRAAVEFYWADLAANYFPARQTMTGPASRNYNSGFLVSDSNVEHAYYFAGLRDRPPRDTLPGDRIRVWTAARLADSPPPSNLLSLARSPERIVRSRFGAEPGRDRYLWLTPALAIGSAGAYYGPQDRGICAEFGGDKNLPLMSFVVDPFDAPFGTVKTPDRSGHNKPVHLPYVPAVVQAQGLVLALIDLAPALTNGPGTNLASNFVLPLRVDTVLLDGHRIDVTKPFQRATGPGSVVILREGGAALAVRLFAATGAGGQQPVWSLEYDGNEAGAGRIVVHHYRGPARQSTTADTAPRCGLLLLGEPCATDAEFAAFQKRARELQPREEIRDGIWRVRAQSGAVELEAGLNLRTHTLTTRRVNGQPWQTEVLSVNGRDLAAETFGRLP